MYFKLNIFALLLLAFLSTKLINGDSNERFTNIDVLEHALKSQQWESNETACLDTMMSTLAHARNFTLWAIWALDSIQLPSGQLYGVNTYIGNYDECVSPRRGFDASEHVPRYQYCMNTIMLTNNIEKKSFSRNPDVSVDLYLDKKTIFRKSLATANLGLCVPVVCEPHSTAKIARAFLKTSHLGPMDNTTRIDVAFCKSGGPGQYSPGFYIFIWSMIIFVIVTIYCSYYSWSNVAAPGSFVGELARSFCLHRNYNELTKLRDDEIFTMNIIRIVTSFLILVGHVVSLICYKAAINVLDSEELLKDVGAIGFHSDVLTDTFFAISGLLFMRGLLTDKHKSPLKYLWKRYVRLIVGLAVSIAYIYAISPPTADGPLRYPLADIEIEGCQRNWWLNFLMMQNIVDTRYMCNVVSWYVSCDYQLSVLAVVLLCVYRRNRSLGASALALVVAVGTILQGLGNYYYKLKPSNFMGTDIHPMETSEFNDFYIKPYTHASVFMIGSLMGYIMYTYKPKHYRKCITQLWSYIGIVLSLVVLQLCMYGGYFFLLVSPDVSLHSAVYTATNRSLWAAAVCTVIAVCEYGDIPFLQKWMSWSPMVPLSRLTYVGYLVQEAIIIHYIGTLRSLVTADNFHLTLISIGVSFYCYVGSLFIWLFVEAPLINLNSMLLYKTWKNKEERPVADEEVRQKIN